MQLRGIDVSHYQGEVDWFAVASGGLAYGFAKATEGTAAVDARFAQNWGNIRDAGLFRGAYHFGRPGSDPEVQATHFRSVVGELGFRDMPPVLDLEESDGHPADAVLAWARAFIEKAEALFARRVLLYTGGFWRFQLGNPSDPFFGGRPLWLAAYRQNPVIPSSWKAWTLWQYSEGVHNGPVQVPGVRGPVDQNVFDGDEAALDRFCDQASATPAPAPPAVSDGSAWPGQYFVWPHEPAISGEAVRKWQLCMSDLGFPIDTDGIYGPQSKRACQAFQKDHGLSVDGVVGRTTWDAVFGV